MANVVDYKKLWEPTDIGTTATTIYTAAPASTNGVIKNISAVVTNTTTSGIELTVTVAGKTFIASEVVGRNSRLPFTVPDMGNGDVITATGSATGLIIHTQSGIPIN